MTRDAAITALEKALRDLIEDLEARWDMQAPSTNPGIKACVEQGKAALSALGGRPETPTDKALIDIGVRWAVGDDSLSDAQFCAELRRAFGGGGRRQAGTRWPRLRRMERTFSCGALTVSSL